MINVCKSWLQSVVTPNTAIYQTVRSLCADLKRERGLSVPVEDMLQALAELGFERFRSCFMRKRNDL